MMQATILDQNRNNYSRIFFSHSRSQSKLSLRLTFCPKEVIFLTIKLFHKKMFKIWIWKWNLGFLFFLEKFCRQEYHGKKDKPFSSLFEQKFRISKVFRNSNSLHGSLQDEEILVEEKYSPPRNRFRQKLLYRFRK